MVARTKLTVAYLGGGFSGWQRQDRARTVQGELESILTKLFGPQRVVVIGAGRTDAGVHAAAQAAHVDLPDGIPPGVLPRLLNARLADDVRVRSAVRVPDDFHAIRSALGKHYAYRIRWTESDLPWQGLRSAVLPRPRHPELVDQACDRLQGRRDWASFTVPGADGRSTVRTIFRVQPVWRPSGLDFHVFGDGFLRYQVRRMVGAVLDVGHGRLTTADLLDLLESPSPGAPLHTAPARGLSLERVYYRASPSLAADPGLKPAQPGPSSW
jgi:tRNA pseudouridine38-40 synthase